MLREALHPAPRLSGSAVLEKRTGGRTPSVVLMETVTSADGTVIAFDQLGSGPPLIVVAGASCDRAVDTAIAAALADRFTVLNYDRRGRGDSTDTPPYAVDREIEDLDVLVSAAGGTATVVGLSSGAVLAAHAAASGLPVRHLVMWEPPFRLDAEGQRQTATYNERLAALLADDDRGGALELFMRMVGVPEPAIAGMRQSPYWALGEGLAPTLAYDAAVMGVGEPRPRSARSPRRPWCWPGARARTGCATPRVRRRGRSPGPASRSSRARPTTWPPTCWPRPSGGSRDHRLQPRLPQRPRPRPGQATSTSARSASSWASTRSWTASAG